MKIAFISYEYPPETGFGGIGTYTRQMAGALVKRGHVAEVFSCTRGISRCNCREDNGVLLHRISAQNRVEFRNSILPFFSERQNVTGFDLIESPEYFAEGLEIRKAFPGIPMVVKLHTPAFLISRLNNTYRKLSFKQRIKKLLGRTDYRKDSDIEFQFTSMADAVCSPSIALARLLEKEWGLKHVDIIPNVFFPSESLLSLESKPDFCNAVVSFIGRLDTRKGIVAFMAAIPLVLKKYPNLIFRFIGGDGEAPDRSGSMKAYLESRLSLYRANIEFAGYFPGSGFAEYLKDSPIVVLPSIWENYPYACLEAMSAGKALVASRNGGMKEMLVGSRQQAFLVNPINHRQLASAIIRLLKNPVLCFQLGKENRVRVLHHAKQAEDCSQAYYKQVVYEKSRLKHA